MTSDSDISLPRERLGSVRGVSGQSKLEPAARVGRQWVDPLDYAQRVEDGAGRNRHLQNLTVDHDILMTGRSGSQLGEKTAGTGAHTTDFGRYSPLAHFLAWPGGTNTPLLPGPIPRTLPLALPAANSVF
jgi:hypothetical protein